MVVKKIIVGIDPGSSSGYVCVLIVFDTGAVEPILIGFEDKLPSEWTKQLDVILLPYVGVVPLLAIVENVQFMPRQGKGAFSMYRNIGHIEMYLVLRKIPAEYISAQKWQKYYIKRAGVKRWTEQKEKKVVSEMRKNKVADEIIINYINEQKAKVAEINAANKEKQKQHRFKMRYRAAQLFPMVKVNDKNSQALLIAYTKLQEGKLVPINQNAEDED